MFNFFLSYSLRPASLSGGASPPSAAEDKIPRREHPIEVAHSPGSDAPLLRNQLSQPAGRRPYAGR